MTVLKDGSNLLVHLAPAPVVLRVATFTALIRGNGLPWLEREVSLISYLAGVGASVMPPSDLVPPGPHIVGGWAMSAWQFVDHERGIVPDPLTALRAIQFGVDREVIGAGAADELRGRRDSLLEDLLSSAPEIQAQHGDAFPRNSLVTKTGVVWIDFEDCCSGPLLWDLATLIRQGGGEQVAAVVRARFGDVAMRNAIALRQVQVDVWNILHDARQINGW
ncbi:MAG TPA: phosphotransferase [Methylomirabilota bacterium]|nr:phosphotransferase [Methylomirabilota bacterium]